MLLILFLIFYIVNAQVNFVAVGDDINIAIAYSNDGILWNSVMQTIFTTRGTGITYGQNKWLATGQGTNSIAYSFNATFWFGLGTSIFSTEGTSSFYSTVQNIWVATGIGTNTLAYSNDGITWLGLGNSIFSTSANDVVFATTLNRWVAVGSGTNTIAYSNDGITWNGLGNIIFTGVNVGNTVYHSNDLNQFVAGGISNTNNLGYSSDGITWNSNHVPISTTIRDVFYEQNKWVLIGPGSPLPTPYANSTDGINWIISPIQTGLTNGNGITYNPVFQRWVAVGSGASTIFYSSDAITWTPTTNLFSLTGHKVATTGQNLTQNSIQTSNEITNDIFDLTTNTSVIPNNVNVNIFGKLLVNGDLTVLGTWNLQNTSNINITAHLIINGNTTYYSTANSFSNLLFINENAPLDIIIQTNASQHTLFTYSNVIGRFALRSLTTPEGPNDCSDVNYGKTAMTVTINTCNYQQFVASTADFTFIIIGVVIACVVVGIIIALIIVVITKRRTKILTAKATENIRKQELLRTQSELKV